MLSSRPNFVFIVADDLGYADLGCYGGRVPISPNLDRLAANGLRFTQGYSNSPVCSPTRFALMTGRWQYRLRGGAEEPLTGKGKSFGLSPEHPTLPSLLRARGYRTALVGKWHLGYPPEFGPLRSGYDEFFGSMAGGVDYFTHCDPRGVHDLWVNDARVERQGYLTDLLAQQAVDFIDRAGTSGQPFFLSLHFTAPHWPWEAREDEAVALEAKKNLFHVDGGSVEVYRRMTFQMDEGIGAVVAALERRGLVHDTFIVFTSDNGGERFSDNWPLVGGKMDLTEGGIRVPWIAHWPAVIGPGAISEQLSMTMDWSATMLAAAGIAADEAYPLDGVSLLPVLRKPSVTFDRPLYWRMNHRKQRAYRDRNWKYLRVDGNDYLFDLSVDQRERANKAAKEPERLQAMREAWEAWDASMPPVPADAGISLAYTAKDMPSR